MFQFVKKIIFTKGAKMLQKSYRYFFIRGSYFYTDGTIRWEITSIFRILVTLAPNVSLFLYYAQVSLTPSPLFFYKCFLIVSRCFRNFPFSTYFGILKIALFFFFSFHTRMAYLRFESVY